MGEFVENRLELLLPLFEQFKVVSLLSDSEVAELVKRCRRYEYRLAKQGKIVNDFNIYIGYLNDLLKLIEIRRKKTGFKHRHKEIEGQIKNKIARLYLESCRRFKGDLKQWWKCIDYLKNAKLIGQCAIAFTEAIQFHARNVNLRCESAEWEVLENKSVENGRSQMQMVLRSNPQEIRYWNTLFKIEVIYVKQVKERIDFLKKQQNTSDKDNEDKELLKDLKHDSTTDAVLRYDLADCVFSEAINNISYEFEKGKMMLAMWREAKDAGSDAASLADLILQKLQMLEDPGFYSFAKILATSDTDNIFIALNEHAEKAPFTETFSRLVLPLCDEAMNYAADKLAYKIRMQLIEHQMASISDIKFVLKQLSVDDQFQELTTVLNQGLSVFPEEVFLWEQLLDARIRHMTTRHESYKVEEITQIVDILNAALKKIPPVNQLPIWRIAIDFSIEYSPETVDELFHRCFVSAERHVASNVKVIYLDFVESVHNVEYFRKEARKIMSMRPNDACVYFHITKLEAERGEAIDKILVNDAFSAAVTEHAYQSSTWLAYLNYQLQHDPSSVSSTYQRANMYLRGRAVDEFLRGWEKIKSAPKHATAPLFEVSP